MREVSNSGRTPTLSETIQIVVDSVLVNVHTSMPGEVVSYDPDTQTADIQPSLKRMYYDAESVKLPVLPGVPIQFPCADKFHMHWTLAPGDPVVILFSERSLDNWKQDGEVSDPDDPRKFNLSDAYAIPGVNAASNAFEVNDPSAFEIVADKIRLSLHPDGKVEFKNDTAELISVLHDITDKLKTLCSTLAGDTTNTLAGPMPLNHFATYTSMSTEIDDLLTKLDSFKE